MAQIAASVLVQISANSAGMVSQLQKANASLGIFSSKLTSLKNQLIGTFGAYQIIGAIKHAVTTIAEFDKAMTAVSVITREGKLTAGFAALENSARTLGSTTQYTAKQVAELQLEFGRLGFSTKEILQSTKATVNLATATGEGLARSAEIAGSTLRAFGLDASEMSRVTDTMATALNESALSLDSFADGIKYVAPVAASLGVSLEETASMMSILADAGIKGTMAGTSLRRIFTLLTKEGKPLQEQLEELAKTGITLAQANDEVGLYAQTSLLVLVKYGDKIKELTTLMHELKGSTEQMARAMEDNLGTAITKVGTAYDNLILSFSNSKGTLRSIAENIADIFNVTASNNISFAEKLVASSALLAGSTKVYQLLAVKAKALITIEEEAAKKRDQLIQDSADVLIRDYGSALDQIEGALYGNVNANEIYLAVLETLKKRLEDQAKALVDATGKKLADADAIAEQNKQYQKQMELLTEHFKLINKYEMQAINKKNFEAGKGDTMGSLISSMAKDSTGNSKDFFKDMREGQEKKFDKGTQQAFDDMARNLEEQRRQVDATRMAWANFGAQMSDSIASTIAADSSMRESFARITASALNSLEQIALARMAADAAKYGVGAILAAAAGFGIVKGLFAKISKGNSSGGGGRANYSRPTTSSYTGGAQNSSNSTMPNITGVIRGQDLFVILETYKANNKFTQQVR